MTTILFQGDSITDCGRQNSGGAGYEQDQMGPGYPGLLKSRITCDYPTRDFNFINRGISGNRIVDLYARWRIDCLNHKPDILSILIGVNDSGHEYQQNGVDVARSERFYRELLQWTRDTLPDVKLVIIEPFTLEDPSTPLSYHDEVRERAVFTRRLAEEFGAVFIPLQSLLDDAVAAGTSPSHWSKDGIHMTPAGHQLLADAWYKAVAL